MAFEVSKERQGFAWGDGPDPRASRNGGLKFERTYLVTSGTRR